MKVLVTGCAGFIGMHVCMRLISRGDEVIGVDNLNDYYDIGLKNDRLKILCSYENFSFYEIDLVDKAGLEKIFSDLKIDSVIHLAAQAGVRYSLSNPDRYIQSNIVGFSCLLELSSVYKIRHLIFASSSSVYGSNTLIPFSEDQNTDHPISLYAATKKAGELIAHSYSHLYEMPITCLRFFTVYGPWGRPDMSPMIFAKSITENKSIDIYNFGKMRRDFTYIDDVVEGLLRALDKPASKDFSYDARNPKPSCSHAPYRIFNIGNHEPVELMEFIEILEEKFGRKAIKNFMPHQPGDVLVTYAETESLKNEIGFSPSTPIRVGIEKFVDWYVDYYGIQ